jgi:hypothetical protein
MDVIAEKRETLHELRRQCGWFGIHGDAEMQKLLGAKCYDLFIEIGYLERSIGQKSGPT